MPRLRAAPRAAAVPGRLHVNAPHPARRLVRPQPVRGSRPALALLAAVAGLLLPGLASADATSDGIAYAKAQIDKHRAKPVFTAPGAPFDAQ